MPVKEAFANEEDEVETERLDWNGNDQTLYPTEN